MNQPDPAHASQSEGEAFVFLAGVPAIDLVNTEVVVRRKSIDLIATPDAYLAWWRAVCAEYPALPDALGEIRADPRLLPAAKDLRRTLRAVFGALADRRPVPADELARLNRLLTACHTTIALDPTGTPRPIHGAREAAADGPILAAARSTVALLTEADLSRLHRCANQRCVLMFYDTTKSATRRWCSVACMNRARSASRYRAQRDAAGSVRHQRPA